jgi:GTP-binding protein
LAKLTALNKSSDAKSAKLHEAEERTASSLEIVDLDHDGAEFVVATGGEGGFGNAHFKSSVRQAPKFAERGAKGEALELGLELKMAADVGLVGFPNAGKSTFLSVVSNARPEIADYAFTTLRPNLGVADVDNSSLLIADIPGLVEGASTGRGLGLDFLRHIERTAVILHLIDVLSNDIAGDYQKIRRELENYSEGLAKKPEMILITKTDTVDEEIVAMQKAELEKVADDVNIFAISAQAGTGVKECLRALSKVVKAERERTSDEKDAEPDVPVITLSQQQQSDKWTVAKQGSEFIVTGAKIENFAAKTDFTNWQAAARLRDIMRKMGIFHELERQGAEPNSVIHIGDEELTLYEQ